VSAANPPGGAAPPGAIRLEFTVDLAAPPDDAFAAVTEAARLERWFCDEAACEPGAGGRLRFAWRRPDSSPQPYEGRWTAWDPPRSAAYRGGHSGYPGGNAGAIRLELAATAGGTRLVVINDLPDRSDYVPIAERYRAAWPRALARLARHVAEPRRHP
jgi:uncharacterized protein YndB with AHSA1/START domain